jgi:hypothetical protein
MTTKRTANTNTNIDDGMLQHRSPRQKRLDAENRRDTLMGVLDHARDADDLVTLVSMLELGEELSPLVRTEERHRRLSAAQAKLDEASELALAELARSRNERH